MNSPGMQRCDRTPIYGNLTGLWWTNGRNDVCERRSLLGFDSQQFSCEDVFHNLERRVGTVNNRTRRLWFPKRLLFLVAALVRYSSTTSADPAVFGSYALNTSIGPILDPAPSQALDFLPNSLGPLNFMQIGSVTFAATVPEPSSLALLSAGLLGLMVMAKLKPSTA